MRHCNQEGDAVQSRTLSSLFFSLKREYPHNEKVQHPGKESAKKVIVYVRIKMSQQDDTVSSRPRLRHIT